ncbi:hypothetical protein [Treponema pectinovorum]|uniref:hypothetical protein n=1 Tax=Treponema pectinovorum TaxID=164 RepID=UPI0011CB5754|nr:hypothetical protein [Treponema pectinovorum]
MSWIIAAIIVFFIFKKLLKNFNQYNPADQYHLTPNETLLTYEQWLALDTGQPIPPQKEGQPLINKKEYEKQNPNFF